ncbi:MAG: DsrH/TusB family sulfur relay protein [Lysobacterales bacterium]
MSSESESGTLHTLVGHTELAWPASLGRLLAAGDSVLLMQEAVWLALAGVAVPPDRIGLPAGVEVCVLATDLDQRGLSARTRHPGVRLIDDAGWVELSERHIRMLTWGGP